MLDRSAFRMDLCWLLAMCPFEWVAMHHTPCNHLKDLEIVESLRFRFLEAKILMSEGDPAVVLVANGDVVCVGVIQENGNGGLGESNLVLLERFSYKFGCIKLICTRKRLHLP